MKTTKRDVLTAALNAAEQHHYAYVTRRQIADVAECSEALVTYHLGTMIKLRRAVIGEAIRVRNWKVMAQALVTGNSRVIEYRDEIKEHM